MTKNTSKLELATKIVDKFATIETVTNYKFDEKTKVITDKVESEDKTISIPETLLGINLSGYGKNDKEAKADLSKRLAEVLESGDISLADNWAEINL